jgi:D-arabinitol dehydrogenase (NADP+)
VNAEKAFRIPTSLSFDEAAFTEPLSCVVHGADMLEAKCGDKILIFGAGPAGILLSQLLQHCGAALVVVAAPTQFKLEALNRLGVKHTVQTQRNNFTSHIEAVRAFSPEGYDVVIDATGNPQVLEHTFQFTKMGSKVLVYGVCNEEDLVPVKPYWIFRNEIKLIGSFAQTHCFDRAISYLEQGVVRVDGLITHRVGLDEYPKALSVLADGKENLKIMVHPTE